MGGVGSRAQLLDEPRRPNHGFENGLQEIAVPANAINFRGYADEFALRVEFNVAPVPPVTDVNAQNSSVADVEDSDMDVRTSGPPLLFEARDDGAALLCARASMSDENIEVWEGCGV